MSKYIRGSGCDVAYSEGFNDGSAEAFGIVGSFIEKHKEDGLTIMDVYKYCEDMWKDTQPCE